MKKIIRLTESDLARIVKQVLKESKKSKPKSITIELTEKWKDRLKQMKDDNSHGFTPMKSGYELSEDVWVKIGSGPYEYGRSNLSGKQTFFFAEYVPKNDEIFVHNMNCFGNAIGRIAEETVASKNFFMSVLDRGISGSEDRPIGCTSAGYSYHKFEDGFEVGSTDHRDYFEIVDTSGSEENEEESLFERYYRKKRY